MFDWEHTQAHIHMCTYTLWDPMYCSPTGSSVHGILQARILEWAAISSSRGSFQPRIEPLSHVSPALAGGFFTAEPPGKPSTHAHIHTNGATNQRSLVSKESLDMKQVVWEQVQSPFYCTVLIFLLYSSSWRQVFSPQRPSGDNIRM